MPECNPDDELVGEMMIDFIHAANMTNCNISYGSDIHLGVRAVVRALQKKDAMVDGSTRTR